MEGAGQDDDAGEEGAQAGAALWSPAVQVGPLGQLADGDEGDRELLAGRGTSYACTSTWTFSSHQLVGDVGMLKPTRVRLE